MRPSTSQIKFPKNLNAEEDLSAITVLSPEHLIIGGDEGHAVEVLKDEGDGTYTLSQTLVLVEDSDQDEVDIEDICCVGSTCYVIGSHSRKRKKVKSDKTQQENRDRLFKAPKPEPTRAVLYQLSVDTETSQLSLVGTLSLEAILAGNTLLEPFLRIPSKENGIDIEGLAIKDNQLYVGFRSPVLRDNFVPILVINPDNFQEYKLSFIQMGGRGIRAMTQTETGFLIIGGPPGDGKISYELYFWEGNDMVPGNDIVPNALSPLGTILTPDNAKAEGLTLMSESKGEFTVLVIYDGIKGGHPTLFTLSKSSFA